MSDVPETAAKPVRVLYTLPDGEQSRILLRTQLLDRLQSLNLMSSEGNTVPVQWIFVSPLAEHERFAEQFSGSDWNVVAWPEPKYSRGDFYLQQLKRELHKQRCPHESHAIFSRRNRFLNPRQCTIARFAKVLRWIPGCNLFLKLVERCVAADQSWRALLEVAQPNAIVLGSGGIKVEETPLARLARRRQIPLLGIIPSWDNLTTKGAPVSLCDELAVWCSLMQNEAVQDYGFDRERVHITGPPGFAPHHCRPTESDRARFFQQASLDPKRKLILYSSVTPAVCPFSAEYAAMLLRLTESDQFREPCQLLVRLHPQDHAAAFDSLRDHPLVRVEQPGRYLGESEGHNAIHSYDPTADETRHLTETVFFSDVVINVASTMTLDACVLNRPVINLAFNPPIEENRFIHVADYYNLTHYRPVTDSGAVPIVRSETELCTAIQSALQSPNQLAEQRKTLAAIYDPFGDGQSAQRLADVVSQFLQQTMTS